MMMRLLTRPIFIVVVLIVTCFGYHGISAKQEEDSSMGLMTKIKRKYDSLTPKGKFAASCTVSFVGSRIALNSAVKCIKIGAAAFITAEALHLMGVLDDIPDLSDEQTEMFTTVKTNVLRKTNQYRIQIRNTLSQDNIKNFVDNEKPAAYGILSGALVATIL